MNRTELRQAAAKAARHLREHATQWFAGSEWGQLLRNLLIAAGSLAAVAGVVVLLTRGGGPPPPAATLPATASTSRPSPSPPASPLAPTGAPPQPARYTVRPGDTLAAIALAHNVPFEQIAAGNGITDPNKITAGVVLSIAARLPGTEVIQRGDALPAYTRRFGVSRAQLVALNPQLREPRALLAGGQIRVAAVPS